MDCAGARDKPKNLRELRFIFCSRTVCYGSSDYVQDGCPLCSDSAIRADSAWQLHPPHVRRRLSDGAPTLTHSKSSHGPLARTIRMTPTNRKENGKPERLCGHGEQKFFRDRQKQTFHRRATNGHRTQMARETHEEVFQRSEGNTG